MQAFVGSVRNAGTPAKSRPQLIEGKLLIHYVEHVDGIEVVNGELVNKRVPVVDVGAWLQSLRTKRPEGLRAITEFKDRVTSAFFMFDEDYSAHGRVVEPSSNNCRAVIQQMSQRSSHNELKQKEESFWHKNLLRNQKP